MTDETKRRGLGRGLSALLDDDSDDYATLDRLRAGKEVPIASIRPNPLQPRRRFAEAELKNLAESISANGIIQPILVRLLQNTNADYEIVVGERRWRAAQLAGIHSIPVMVREVTDAQSVELALIENIQREDLTPIEEAEAYQQLIADHGQTQDEIAVMIGKSRSHVANTVRLLSLPEAVRQLVQEGALAAGHARALIGHADALALAQRIVRQGLNVRQVEELVRQSPPGERQPRSPPAEADANTRALEQSLSQALGLKVQVRHGGDRGGEVRISYKSLDQLDEICQRLSQPEPGDPGQGY